MPESDELLLGLIGYPLGHSLSPALHEFLMNAIRRRGRYELFETPNDRLGETIQALTSRGTAGFNVTIPHKQAVVPYLDEISEDAQLIGAVNTVSVRNNHLVGFNTDGIAFKRVLEMKKMDMSGKTAVVLGAGGAARAVTVYLIRGGVQNIYLLNRTAARAEQAANYFFKMTGYQNILTAPLNAKAISNVLNSAQLIINATSVGMWPHIDQLPYQFNFDASHLIAVDLVYNPLETRFLRSARSAGAAVVDGLDLFIFQGIEAMKIWTRGNFTKVDCKKIRGTLIEKLKSYGTN